MRGPGPTTARRIILANRPMGAPDADTFDCVEVELGAVEDGEILVDVELVSLAPAMRGWLDDKPSYMPPIRLGDPMRAKGFGTVRQSCHRDFRPGDRVTGPFGVATAARTRVDHVTKVNLELAPATTWLGALDSTGLTAYFGLLHVGRLAEGDNVVVSAAAGGVGSVVGQIAKIHGCRVIGIAGGPQKCRWVVDELGFDAAIDHRAGGIANRLGTLAPDGIDVYFDNVGGEQLEAALDNLALGARVVICGAISGYNDVQARGPRNYLALLVHRATMAGFITTDFQEQFPAAIEQLGKWIAAGRIVAREHVVDAAVEDFLDVFTMLFEGSNTGKLLMRLPGAAPAG
jgi:NADPH-dependent curcumin reductase CurA